MEYLILAEEESGGIAGFMGIQKERLEMLFLSPKERGKGIGRGMERLKALTRQRKASH